MSRFLQFLRDDRGSAVIEFVLVFPLVFTIFTASVESSMYMVRYVMFDRAIDKVVRNLRLGAYGTMTHQLLKEKICTGGMLVSTKAECMNRMKIWMQPINTGAGFAMGSTNAACVDKASDINTGEPLASNFSYASTTTSCWSASASRNGRCSRPPRSASRCRSRATGRSR